MAISFNCSRCGKAYQVDERFAGKKAACRACGAVNRIPSEDRAGSDVALSPEAPATTSLQTRAVRVPFAAGDALPLRAGSEETTVGQVVPSAESAAAEEGLELVDGAEPDLKPAPRKATALQRVLPVEGCPNCGAALPGGSQLCTACGFNLKTGKKISTAVVKTDAGEAGEEEEGTGDLLAAPNKSLRYSALSLIILGLVLTVVPVFGTQLRMMALLGAMVVMIGALIYFIDGAWEWGLAGAGAMVVSIAVFLACGTGRAATPVPSGGVSVAVVAPATTTAPADPGPKVSEITAGKYSVRAPLASEDAVEYWRPVLRDTDPQIRVIAIERLAKLPEPLGDRAADAVAEVAADPNINVRRAAIGRLGIAKTSRTVAAAITAMDDTDPAIALQAVKLLGQYKDDSAIDPLARKYATLGLPVLAALGGYDAASREKVLAAYKSLVGTGMAGERMKAIDAIAGTDSKAATGLLMDQLADGDAEVRRAAMGRLAEMKYAAAIGPIAERLRDDSEAAAKALVKFGPDAEKAVTPKVATGEQPVRLAALGVLKEIGGAQSLEVVKATAKDPESTVATAAREVWRKIEPGTLTPIDEALMDLDGGKEMLTRSLGTLKGLAVDEHQAVVSRKLFEIVMGSGDAPVRASAYEALTNWADATTRDLILASLKSEDEGKREYAIKLVVHFKDARAVKPLCQCLAEGKNVASVMDALREFDTAPEEFLIPLIPKGEAALQGNCFDLLRDIGTRRCFMALNAVANNKTGDDAIKKRAKETMIAINRRLNTAAARKGTATTRPATQPQTAPVQH